MKVCKSQTKRDEALPPHTTQRSMPHQELITSTSSNQVRQSLLQQALLQMRIQPNLVTMPSIWARCYRGLCAPINFSKQGIPYPLQKAQLPIQALVYLLRQVWVMRSLKQHPGQSSQHSSIQTLLRQPLIHRKSNIICKLELKSWPLNKAVKHNSSRWNRERLIRQSTTRPLQAIPPRHLLI